MRGLGMAGEPTDRNLVARVRAGETIAFGQLVDRYLRPALAVAWEFTESRDDAEDLAQEAFHRALRKLDRFNEERPFGPWLFAIVRNLGRNAAAKARRWRYVPIPAGARSADDPSQRAEARDIEEHVERGMNELPPMQRACFRLCQLEGFDAATVAEMLGISAPTVRTHVHRARRALQQSLAVLRDERNTE